MSAKSLKLEKIYVKFISFYFFLDQNLDSPKTPLDINFDLSRHAKSILTTATSFVSSAKVAIESILLWRNFDSLNYSLRFLRLASDSPKKIQEVFFIVESFQFSNPGFPIFTDLMSSLKI